VTNPDENQSKIGSTTHQTSKNGAAGGKHKNSRTLLILLLGWLVVFAVLAFVLTNLKLGGTEPLKSDEAPTPALGEPEVRS